MTRWLSPFVLALFIPLACADDSSSGGAGQGAGGGGARGGGSPTGGTGGGVTVGCISGLKSLALSPSGMSFPLDGGPTTPITFSATGTFDDQSQKPIDGSALAWSVTRADDTDPGTIQAGVLAPNPSAGGVVTVTATDTCVSGSTTATFILEVEIGTPQNPGDWTGTPVTDSAPTIVYPSDQTRFPRNLFRTLFQWRKEGMSEFRLVFDGPYSDVTVYTDGAHGLCSGANPAAGCWEVDDTDWGFIAGSNAGETAAWYVDGLDTSTDPPTIRRAGPVTLGFSKQDVEGAIFYWSTTSKGVRRGRISEQDPQNYVVGTPSTVFSDGDQVGCVACHTVSRDGKYMVAPTKTQQADAMFVYEVTADAPPTPLVKTIANTKGHGFGTISPDDAHVVVAYKGAMWMVNRVDGAEEAAVDLGGLKGTHPDWSPADDELVFAAAEGDAPKNAHLAKVPWDGTQWGAPVDFLTPPMGQSYLFPMYSMGADWIAFSRGAGGHGDASAQLMVVDAAGAMPPIELENANKVVNNGLTDGAHENNQPTWAPPGDLEWVAFNSKRAFGVVLPEGTQQIWVAAVDPDKAALGDDPSYPAFRVPFQGLDENNHRAFWTLDVGDGGPDGGGGAGPGCGAILPEGAACDPFNDCCETGMYCDTLDGGTTYECIKIVPQ